MRIFVFELQTRMGLHAFAGDIAGSRLPARVGPWRLIHGSPPGGSLPHGIPRRPIERAIVADGFQMWRLKINAPANDGAARLRKGSARFDRSSPADDGAARGLRRQRLMTNASSFFFESRWTSVSGDVPPCDVRRSGGAFSRPHRDRVARRSLEPGAVDRLLDPALPRRQVRVASGRRQRPAASTSQRSRSTRRLAPDGSASHVFRTENLVGLEESVEIGASLLIVGFPLGFHDTLHHMAVARQAALASAFGLRFQGHGYFLTDARTHRGSSGAPVVMRAPEGATRAARAAVASARRSRLPPRRRLARPRRRRSARTEFAWYADILPALTEG